MANLATVCFHRTHGEFLYSSTVKIYFPLLIFWNIVHLRIYPQALLIISLDFKKKP
jgi:hypothetical protein